MHPRLSLEKQDTFSFKKRKLKILNLEGYKLITDPKSGLITFGTHVWVRQKPFEVIIQFPAWDVLKAGDILQIRPTKTIRKPAEK